MTTEMEKGAGDATSPTQLNNNESSGGARTGLVNEKTSLEDGHSGNASDKEDVAAKEDETGPQRSKAEIAVVMSALCVCGHCATCLFRIERR